MFKVQPQILHKIFNDLKRLPKDDSSPKSNQPFMMRNILRKNFFFPKNYKMWTHEETKMEREKGAWGVGIFGDFHFSLLLDNDLTFADFILGYSDKCLAGIDLDEKDII